MNPIVLFQLLAPLLQQAAAGIGTAVPQSVSPPSAPAAPAQPLDPAVLAALVSALAQSPTPSQPAQPAKMPAVASTLAVMITVAFSATLGCLLWVSLFGSGSHTADPALWLLLGVLSSCEVTILGFYFGSSLGSWFSRTATAGQGGAPIALPPLQVPTPQPTSLPLPPPSTGPAPLIPTPTQDNFPRCLAPILKWEGGYSNDPGDSGGPTNLGITQKDLSDWLGRQASIQDVKDMSLDTATAIYRKRYWDPLLCDQLQVAIALMTFNCGVNSGVSRGAKFLQQTLNRQNAGIDEDGEVGPLTIAAAAKVNVKQAVIDYASIYESFYRGLGNFGTFGRGWLNRLSDVKEIALGWSSEAGPTPAVLPSPPATGPFAGAPPWFLLALHEVGKREEPENRGPVVQEYIDQAHTGTIGDPWCAIFVNAMLENAGLPGTRSPAARSFASNDNFVKLNGPALGAIAVYWRGSIDGAEGHVGLYRGEDATRVWTLGGNEADQVEIAPMAKSSSSFGLIGYWWPKTYALPAIGAIQMQPADKVTVTVDPTKVT